MGVCVGVRVCMCVQGERESGRMFYVAWDDGRSNMEWTGGWTRVLIRIYGINSYSSDSVIHFDGRVIKRSCQRGHALFDKEWMVF